MNYFQKRELEWQKQQIKDDKRRMAEIKAMMVELQDAIQEEIERNWYVFSSGQGISMEEAYKRSNELDVVRFAKKAKKYVKNRDFSPQANKELKLYNLTMRVNRLELLKANIGLELIRTFDEIDKYVSNELTTVAKEEMKRQAGILYIDVSKNEYTSMLKQIANGSFQGVEFSNLIWSYQNELKADLSKLLQRSIVLGRNPKMLAPELKKYLTEEGKLNAKFNTQRLMVSETTNIQIAIQKQSYLDAGIEKYGYNVEPNACSVCAKLKDKTFLVSEMMPGKNAPSMHPFCRCSTYPVFEIEHAVDELKQAKEHVAKYFPKQYELNQAKRLGQKVNITEQAISKVKMVRIPGLSEIESRNIQIKHKELLDDSMKNNNSDETMYILKGSYQVSIYGNRVSVNPNISTDAIFLLNSSPSRSLDVLHNHPGLSSFSMNDLNFFMSNQSVRTLTIVTNQGKVMYITKTDHYNANLCKANAQKTLNDLKMNNVENQSVFVERMIKSFYNAGVRYKLR